MNAYKYFAECQTLEEAKALYKKLARENHPDMGGDLRTMQEINAEFARYQAEGAKTEARTRQQQAHAEDRKSAADYHDLDEVGEQIRTMIEFALNLEGVEIELMGLWVWLTGNTKAHKEAIKENQGWKWAKHKEAWFFAGVPSFNRHEKTLDEIRNLHGSQRFAHPQYHDESVGALSA